MNANRALDAALALARNPALAPVMRRQAPPPGVTVLLQMLSGDDMLVGDAARAARIDRATLLICVERYVQETMLFPGAPPRRVLGVSEGSSVAEMRGHLKLLMMWLHPDQSDDPWRAAFASRVLEAWRAAGREPAESPVAAAPRAARRRAARLTWVKHPLPRKRRRLGWRVAFVAVALIVLASVGLFQMWPIKLASVSDPGAANASEPR